MAYQYYGYQSGNGYPTGISNNYYPQQPMVQQPMQSGFRPVASKDEAAMAQVPFDGNMYIFVNPAADEVYIKQFNVQTGNTDFKAYSRQKQEVAPAAAWATKEDIDALRKEIVALRGGNEE